MSDDEQDFEVPMEEPVMIDDQENNQDQGPPMEELVDNSKFDYLIKKCSGQLNKEDDIHLMVIDIDYETKDDIPILRIFGTTQHGETMCCFIYGFRPYLYLPLPAKVLPTPQNAQSIMEELNKFGKNSAEIKTQGAITEIQFVHKNNIRLYCSAQESENKPINFMKIYTKNPQLVNKYRSVFHDGFSIEGERFPTQSFQSNIPFLLRFLVDKSIVGMGWIRIKGSTYAIVPKQKFRSVCQREICCQESSVQAVSGETRWDKLAPMRILSFDIECGAERGFPEQKKDPIITIGVVCKTMGDPNVQKIVLTLNSCLPIPGVQVVSETDERKLLQNFQTIIRVFDPDFIIGYNMVNFDFKYIMNRAQALKMTTYGYFSRMKYTRSKIKKEKYLSKAMGMRETHEISIVGRIKLDMMIHMHGEHQLSSYSLNSVSAIFLNEEKQDVHHSQIYSLFIGSSQTRKRLAEYCVKDAYLPLKLMEKLMCLYNYTEMARVTGVPINFLFKRGQQIKVISQLLRKIKDLDLVIPVEFSKAKQGTIGYQGASVLNPKPGFYKDPVATLDFASLYPSIMMAHNLCYTTLLNPRDIQRLGYKESVHYERSYNGISFVKSEVKKGILPQILHDLISARKKAKQELAKAVDEQLIAVLDGRQLALKISANSVYGFTGALVGQLPCLEISATVTAIGRNLIDFTSKRVVELFPGSEVLYGDTDSVMVKFPIGDFEQGPDRAQLVRAEAMDYGRRAAKLISDEINKPPIKLQFEKVYSPFLLMAKKRYSGYLYTKPQKADKIDKKGFESVRRDNCHLIRQILETVLKKLFQGQEVKESLNFIKDKISNLLMNRIDLSDLIITKSINRKIGEREPEKNTKKNDKDNKNQYKVKQAHVQLAERMMKRNPEIVIEIGDRIPYIIVKGTKGTKNYQNAEDPERVQNEDLPIDFDYYIEKQIRPPLERLLVDTKIITNIDPLFSGEHTKNRYIPRLAENSRQGLGGFIKKISKCTSCNVPSEQTLCSGCQPNHIDIYLKKQQALHKQAQIYGKLWTHCQDCQGSVLSENFCRNTDCKIYYKRSKVKKQINELKQVIVKLENLEW